MSNKILTPYESVLTLYTTNENDVLTAYCETFIAHVHVQVLVCRKQ